MRSVRLAPRSRVSIPRRRRAAVLATVGALLLAALATFGIVATSSSAATPITVTASADAYVESDLPDTNFGTATELGVRAPSDKPELISYVRFSVQGLTAPPAGVRLQLYSYAQSATGLQVWTSTSDWTET